MLKRYGPPYSVFLAGVLGGCSSADSVIPVHGGYDEQRIIEMLLIDIKNLSDSSSNELVDKPGDAAPQLSLLSSKTKIDYLGPYDSRSRYFDQRNVRAQKIIDSVIESTDEDETPGDSEAKRAAILLSLDALDPTLSYIAGKGYDTVDRVRSYGRFDLGEVASKIGSADLAERLKGTRTKISLGGGLSGVRDVKVGFVKKTRIVGSIPLKISWGVSDSLPSGWNAAESESPAYGFLNSSESGSGYLWDSYGGESRGPSLYLSFEIPLGGR
jgi:hypothetical protein